MPVTGCNKNAKPVQLQVCDEKDYKKLMEALGARLRAQLKHLTEEAERYGHCIYG